MDELLLTLGACGVAIGLIATVFIVLIYRNTRLIDDPQLLEIDQEEVRACGCKVYLTTVCATGRKLWLYGLVCEAHRGLVP